MSVHFSHSTFKIRSNRLELAPLLDIIFILLIFFAVSTSLLLQNKGIKLTLPLADSVTSTKKGIILAIDSSQRLLLNQQELPLADLKPTIGALLTKHPKLQLIIHADRATPYHLVISILDEIRLGGCSDIVLEAKKKVPYAQSEPEAS